VKESKATKNASQLRPADSEYVGVPAVTRVNAIAIREEAAKGASRALTGEQDDQGIVEWCPAMSEKRAEADKN
jgi:hypothetical protein